MLELAKLRRGGLYKPLLASMLVLAGLGALAALAGLRPALVRLRLRRQAQQAAELIAREIQLVTEAHRIGASLGRRYITLPRYLVDIIEVNETHVWARASSGALWASAAVEHGSQLVKGSYRISPGAVVLWIEGDEVRVGNLRGG